MISQTAISLGMKAKFIRATAHENARGSARVQLHDGRENGGGLTGTV